ncbi:IS66 family transposase [Paludisphaera soli]|uniref:IS66 family transposase n=1 Tax=Paludisphaera soli TaxID=2712865 RepID=UPI0019810CAC|nr:IS66 family transposase [Paludisphaera soli]
MESAVLPDDLATCHGMIREMAASLRDAQRQVEQLGHRLDLLLRRLFGPRSERVDPGQLLLFFGDGAEGTPDAVPAPESPVESPAPPPTGRAKGHGRKPLPADLPRERRVHELPPEQRACPDCGLDRSPIGEEVSEQLDYRPASLFVVEHVRVKVACRHCQGHVAVADKPPQPIEKGLPGPGLLAQVITSKFADHLPLYRQEGIFARHGVELSRKTMCGWMAQAAWLLEPIWRVMRAEVLKSRVIQTDDTTVPVLDRRLDRARTARLWVYLGDREHPYAIYDYTADRSRDGPERFLGDYKGCLQADAYSAYDRIYSRGVVEVGCFAHARRKFYDARTSDPQRAHEALARIRALYAVEATGKDLDEAGRLALRRERSGPILERLGTWLDEQSRFVLPKSPIGGAIGYARSNWAALNRFTEAGFLAIDNNASERAVKPVAIGRRNWLFAGSEGGGKAAAVLFSLATTCNALRIDPFAYLRDVLDRVSINPARKVAELLPDRWWAAHSESRPTPAG